MLLAIDIGNTNIVLGVCAGSVLVHQWRMATDARRMPDEYTVTIDSLFRISRVERAEIDGVVIGSVVPAVCAALTLVCRDFLHLEPLIVSSSLDPGIEIQYSPRTAVGADRIANALAAIHLYGSPCIIVDFGTATTVDAISREGAYVGGAIAPGLEIGQEALFRATAQLPRVALQEPDSPIGRTTVSSLQSGILYGYAGLVDGLVDRFRTHLGSDSHVTATGGLASLIAPLTRTVSDVHPELTLLGLRLLYERNTVHAVGAGLRQG